MKRREATYRYDRSKGHENALSLVGSPYGKEGNQIGFELNILSRFIWGRGASVNAVYNCGGPFVLFQHQDKEMNESRAKLTTKVWRFCKKEGMHISGSIFLERDNRDGGKRELTFSENFEEIVSRLKVSKEMFELVRSGDLKDLSKLFAAIKGLGDMELHYLGKLLVKGPMPKDVVDVFLTASKDGDVPSRARVNIVFS